MPNPFPQTHQEQEPDRFKLLEIEIRDSSNEALLAFDIKKNPDVLRQQFIERKFMKCDTANILAATDLVFYELQPGVYYIPNCLSKQTVETEYSNAVTQKYLRLAEHNTNLGHADAHCTESLIRNGSLRWISLGVGYNWSTRSYEMQQEPPAPLPESLVLLAKTVTSSITASFSEAPQFMDPWANFRPDCAICNYYTGGDRLRGHQDDAEATLDYPLISASIGAPAVFLVGTDRRADKPQAIVLYEGDVIVLGGPGRNVYHGVPRLLNYTKGLHKKRLVENLRLDMRLNFSIRQCRC